MSVHDIFDTNKHISIAYLRKAYGRQSQEHYHTQPQIVQEIANAIAPLFRLNPEDIFIPRRRRDICDARKVLQFALVRGMGMGLTEAGRVSMVGGVDHTTVVHSCKVVGHIAKTVPAVDTALTKAVEIARMRKHIESIPCPAITGLHLKPEPKKKAA